MTAPETDHGGTGPCGPGPCAGDDLPVHPFLALRVAFGMLLCEDDFRVLMGNARGKLMLHQAWQHGPGVVWGLPVRRDGDELRVGPGLAVDGLGRELHLESSWCLSLRKWAKAWIEKHPEAVGKAEAPPEAGKQETEIGTGRHRPVKAWILAEFASCLDSPVPALADPCDVTRRHDDFSRVVEGARITVTATPPRPWHPYHRVRVLLGLEEPGMDDPAGREARRVADEVAAVPAGERARALLVAFRRLAAEDATELAPEKDKGEVCPSWAPVTEDHAGVVLAALTVEVTEDEGCVEVGKATVDPWVRTAVLPTTTVQELTCALAPGLIGAAREEDAGGPRLVRPSVRWRRENTLLEFRVTKPLAPGSAEVESMQITSLDPGGRGWATDEVARIRITDDGLRVVVDLDQRPAYETVRVRIRGTGPKPLYGRDPHVPFAGVDGGPPAGPDEGHDAVLTEHLPLAPATGRTEA
ncbi:hypothetical protein AB0H69_04760 [Streptomyces phaeochromogenes]|uniref:hypothetical protein n=1 Tax=Streptomyces phaeochromogenes TaxID=1923 RepID=UPI0033F4EAA8